MWNFIVKNWTIHKAGYPFVGISILLLIIFTALFGAIAFIVFIFITLAIVVFFRIPQRFPIHDSKYLVSPGCGQVDSITRVTLPSDFPLDGLSKEKCNASWTKVSVFLSVMDVHINRIPTNGVIKNITYIPGKFINAQLDKDSKNNERQIFEILTKENTIIYVVQIAGLIARRILTSVSQGEKVEQGQELGFIRFGSRMDLYVLDENYRIETYVGQHTIDGETILASYHETTKKKSTTHPEPVASRKNVQSTSDNK